MIAEIEDEDVDEGHSSPVEEDEQDIASEDEGCNLMLRRSCLTPKQEEEASWLKSNIFQSTCTILERFVNL